MFLAGASSFVEDRAVYQGFRICSYSGGEYIVQTDVIRQVWDALMLPPPECHPWRAGTVLPAVDGA